MNLLLTTESHVTVGPDGRVFAQGPANYAFWSQYLAGFENVTVLARARMAQEIGPERSRADGPGVRFRPLPDFYGPLQFLAKRRRIKAIARQAVVECDAHVLRVPGLVGHAAWRELRSLERRYALEVLGDPWESLAPGTGKDLFRPIGRRLMTRELRQMCKGAAAVHYVTNRVLQERFPAAKDAYTTAFSDALMECAFAPPEVLMERFARIERMQAGEPRGLNPFQIGFVGSLFRLYKGPDILLRAVALMRENGAGNVQVRIAGNGHCLPQLKRLAVRMKIDDRVEFLGQLAFGEALFAFLDSIDLLALPSRAEGLPRTLLEAMARGCPCIATEVGGVAELLDAADLVPRENPQRLAEAIAEVAQKPGRLREMARRNLEKAADFRPEILMSCQREFLSQIREISRADLKTK